MPYEIESYVGAGALRFGMSPAQVHDILGNPRFARSDPGRLREMYGMSPALTFRGTDQELKLVEIGFAKEAEDVTYRGASLFAGERRATMRKLCDDDRDPEGSCWNAGVPRPGNFADRLPQRTRGQRRRNGFCAWHLGCAACEIEAIQAPLKTMRRHRTRRECCCAP